MGNLYPLQRSVQCVTLGLVLVIGGFALRRVSDSGVLLCLSLRLRWLLGVVALLMVAALALAPHSGMALLELAYLLLLAATGVLVAVSEG